MVIVYSTHAKTRMKQRGIAEFEVAYVLSHSEYTREAGDGKREAVGRAQHRTITIIFTKKEKYINIITVM